MRAEEFKKVFKEQYYKLDMFFHNKLRNAELFKNMEITKKGLIHETAVRVWTRLQSEGTASYDMITLIWLCAPDIWKGFIKPKKRSRERYMDTNDMEQIAGTYEITDQLESADYISKLGERNDAAYWDIIKLHAEGHTFNELANIMGKSRTTIKNKWYYFQEKLKGNDHRPPDESE